MRGRLNNSLIGNDVAKINRTHAVNENSFEAYVEILKRLITKRGDLQHVSSKRQLEIIDQLCDFPLGRFILERKGANGRWTDYMVNHPNLGKISGLNSDGIPFSSFEDWFLNECPIVYAHQERFQIFQILAQHLLKDNIVLASIPCGLMRDLILLDYSGIDNFELIGIDIDPESLNEAKTLAHQNRIENIKLIEQDAWALSFNEEIDVITSSGLNVYESDPNKVLELYTRFYNALKPGGYLITSVLTYPPGESTETDWDTRNISPESLLLERILHKDILGIKWSNFRRSSELENEFRQVGFSEVSVYFDKNRIFPTILARK